MTLFAGHLPTKHFDLAEWQAMPIHEERNDGSPPQHEGFNRTKTKNGKPIVFYWSWDDLRYGGYAVRPIVRVKMGRA
jgi:hypothetical protein